ncbi:MAG: hypothetical protein KBT04_05860 [Bacteroidales bacterium]|nr:hypothetical protein [Candidatus Colimorpha onthohippi]
MKQIMIDLQEYLMEVVPQLRHVDRNWNQLSYEQPPVRWPCALIDIEQIDATELRGGRQMATATVSVTLADQVLGRTGGGMLPTAVATGATAAQRESVYALIDLCELVRRWLTNYSGHTPGSEYQGLILQNITHQYSDKSYDVYKLTFSTAFVMGM